MRPWPRVILSLLLLGVFGTLIAFDLLGARPGGSGGASSGGTPRPRDPVPGGDAAYRPGPPAAPEEEEPLWPGAALEGEVLAGGRRASGAEAEWLLSGPEADLQTQAARARTDLNGRFRLLVPPGQLGTLRILMAGSPPLLRHGVLSPPAAETLDLGRLELPRARALEVLVLDRAEGQPVGGAALRLERPRGLARPGDLVLEAETGADGRGRLGPAAPGPWRLEVRAPGFSPLGHPVDLASDGGPGEATVYLPRGPGLAGRVLDAHGTGRAGIVVRAVPRLEGDRDERASGTTTTGPEGAFLLEGLAAGRWLLEASGAGLASPEPLAVNVPMDAPLQLELLPVPILTGTVRTPGGPAPPGTRVFLAHPRKDAAFWVLHPSIPAGRTDASGRFELLLDPPPGPGPWEVVAQAPGWLPVAGPSFPLDRGARPAPMLLVLEEGQEINGRLVPGEGGSALLGWGGAAALSAFLPAQPPLTARTGPEGAFRLAPVRPGPQLLRLAAPGRVPRLVTVSVEPGKSTDLGPVPMASGWRPRGILLGPSGAPEPGGLVWLIPLPQGEPIQAVAGAGGAFRFPPLPAGRYILKACRRDLGDLERVADYGATTRTVELGGGSTENLGTIGIAPLGSAGSERFR